MTIIKKYQPYDFDVCSDNECNIKQPVCWQVANTDDSVSIQFDDPENFLGNNLVKNWQFTNSVGTGSVAGGEVAWWDTTAGVDWNASTNQACSGSGNISSILYQEITINECECFRLLFDLTTNLNANCELDFLLYDGSNWVVIETWGPSFDADTDIEVVHCATTDYERIGFQISTNGCDGDKCIDNIRLQKYDVDIEIRDCDDVPQAQVSDCDITFYSTHWTVEFDWDDYINTIGCYKICFTPNFIKNGNFQSILFTGGVSFEGWSETGTGTAWVPQVGFISAQIPNNSISTLLTNEIELPVCEYTLTFNLDGTNVNMVVTVYYNDILLETFTNTEGNKSITFTPIEEITGISFQVENVGAGGAIRTDLSNVEILETICSKCTCVDTHECTLLLSGTQADSAADFFYTNDFTFWLRIRAELLNLNNDFDEEIHRESTGQSNLIFGDILESEDMKVYLQPKYIWKTIQRLMIHKEFRIDGVEYVKKPGRPEIRWEDNFGEGTVTVTKKNQLQRN